LQRLGDSAANAIAFCECVLHVRTCAHMSGPAPCEVCGGTEFVPAEYTSEAGRAPALECIRCRALNLDESAAHDEKERDSVKLAKAVRANICNPPRRR
jgi:hypothetical protein